MWASSNCLRKHAHATNIGLIRILTLNLIVCGVVFYPRHHQNFPNLARTYKRLSDEVKSFHGDYRGKRDTVDNFCHLCQNCKCKNIHLYPWVMFIMGHVKQPHLRQEILSNVLLGIVLKLIFAHCAPFVGYSCKVMAGCRINLCREN